MSSISITAELGTAEATARLQDIIDRMSNRRPFFESVGSRLIKSASDNFQAESAPDGAAWTPLQASTMRSRKAKGQLPLTILRSNSPGKSGSSLAGSIVAQSTDSELRVGSDVIYAAIHQLGGSISRAAGSRTMVGRRFAKAGSSGGRQVATKAYTITIPARPFLGMSPEDEIGILESAEEWLSL